MKCNWDRERETERQREREREREGEGEGESKNHKRICGVEPLLGSIIELDTYFYFGKFESTKIVFDKKMFFTYFLILRLSITKWANLNNRLCQT